MNLVDGTDGNDNYSRNRGIGDPFSFTGGRTISILDFSELRGDRRKLFGRRRCDSSNSVGDFGAVPFCFGNFPYAVLRARNKCDHTGW